MTALQATSDRGFGASLAFSTVIHLLVFLAFFWWNWLAPTNLVKQETYYVDIVNLPVAAPQAGTSAQKGPEAEPPAPIAHEQMALPAPRKPEPAKVLKNAKTPVKAKPIAEAETFEEKMARLEGKVESREQEAKLESLRRKVTTSGSGKAGMPGGKGTQVGSDYAAYIQSRIRDAFHSTIFYTTKNPVVLIRVVIDTDGKLSRRKTERTTGDRAFELSAQRAIELASQKFTPPPDHKVYEGVFEFKPEGISNKKP
jgi:colicin import membrane protein